jgi:hypothetical protein
MDPTLNLILGFIALIGLGVALYNFILILRGRNRYLACTISIFAMGAADAFLHRFFLARIAAFMILLLALYRWLDNKF